jgi:hypothetical protein
MLVSQARAPYASLSVMIEKLARSRAAYDGEFLDHHTSGGLGWRNGSLDRVCNSGGGRRLGRIAPAHG